MVMTVAEAHAALTAPGAFFELVDTEVLGVPAPEYLRVSSLEEQSAVTRSITRAPTSSPRHGGTGRYRLAARRVGDLGEEAWG